MKKALSFLLSVCLLSLYSCNGDDKVFLEISNTSTENIAFEGLTLKFEVSSSDSWTVVSDRSWCVVNTITNGAGDKHIEATVEANLSSSVRTATITIKMAGVTKTVIVSQNSGDIDTYVYKLPVVFHILHHPNNPSLNFSKDIIDEYLSRVNLYFDNTFKKGDVRVEFVMAEYDPSDNKMAEAGIVRSQMNFEKISAYDFINNKKDNHLYMLWDLDRYINIFMFDFTENAVLGIGTYPYLVAPDNLDGCIQLDYVPKMNNINHMQSVAINSSRFKLNWKDENKGRFVGDCSALTLAHELGHYLGLHHIFSEASEEVIADTDYCTDTPTYNRDGYIRFLSDYMASIPKLTFEIIDEVLTKRTNPLTGEISKPDNMMDYEISWGNRITPQQINRMRYILTHSPFIPGPKVVERNRLRNSDNDDKIAPPQIVQ